MKLIDVVCGVVLNKNEKILITQRKDLNNKWEFPGGKINPKESVQNSIIREIKEELNIDVVYNKILFKTEHKPFRLIFVMCDYISGKICLKEHLNFMWIEKTDLIKYDFLEGDKNFINFYLKK